MDGMLGAMMGGAPQGGQFPVPQDPRMAAQNAAPTAGMPGGGPQRTQFPLMQPFQIMIAGLKQLSGDLNRMGKADEAVNLDNYTNRITKMMLKLEDEYQEGFEQQQVMAQIDAM